MKYEKKVDAVRTMLKSADALFNWKAIEYLEGALVYANAYKDTDRIRAHEILDHALDGGWIP